MATKKASKKSAAKKPAAKKKLDGKALAAKRKPRDSVAQFIKDELVGGATDVDKIIERSRKDFPKAKPTRGYVRWIAKNIGREKQVMAERVAAKPAKKPTAKPAAKRAVKKVDEPKADATNDVVDPAS